MDHIAQDGEQSLVDTLGSRWRQRMARLARRDRVGPRWVKLATALQQKYALPCSPSVRSEQQEVVATAPSGLLGFAPEPDPLQWLRPELAQQTGHAPTSRSASQPPSARQAVDGAPVHHPSVQPGERALPPQLPKAVQQKGYERLDARVQALLTGLLQIRIPAVKLYVNATADALLKSHHADALTYGDNILLRTDKYQPHTPAGLGLLGHEVTHVAQAGQGGARRVMPTDRGERHEQEVVALRNEQQILHQLATPGSIPPTATLPSIAQPQLPVHMHTGIEGVARALPVPVAQPQAAASDRQVSPPPVRNLMPAAAAPLSEQQLKQIYDYFRSRIRTEFERGG